MTKSARGRSRTDRDVVRTTDTLALEVASDVALISISYGDCNAEEVSDANEEAQFRSADARPAREPAVRMSKAQRRDPALEGGVSLAKVLRGRLNFQWLRRLIK